MALRFGGGGGRQQHAGGLKGHLRGGLRLDDGLSLDEALAIIGDLKPKRALLTHIGHDLGHEALSRELAERGFANVSPAYDGLSLDLLESAP